jgi:enamine deaminase RidA (YjgF/YER057c/UK114 family)
MSRDKSKEFSNSVTLPPPIGYSHIAKVTSGTLIYISGQEPTD